MRSSFLALLAFAVAGLAAEPTTTPGRFQLFAATYSATGDSDPEQCIFRIDTATGAVERLTTLVLLQEVNGKPQKVQVQVWTAVKEHAQLAEHIKTHHRLAAENAIESAAFRNGSAKK